MAGSNVEFPADLVTEILLKLPVKSIIRFKCVAKTWYHLFKSPTFVSQHLSLSKKNSRDNNLSLVLVLEYIGVVENIRKSRIGMLSLSDDQTLVSYHDLHQELPSHVADEEYFSIAISDGLVCLYDYQNWELYGIRPQRNFRILPHCNVHIPLEGEELVFSLIGSGMDPLSNDYKVLHINESCEFPVTFGHLIPLLDDRMAFWDATNMKQRTEPCVVWVLNDEENWTKLINIVPVPNVLTVYGLWMHGKVFVEDTGVRLLLYDHETREFSELGFEARSATVYTYEESLVAVNRE